jgi:hypothetical protein
MVLWVSWRRERFKNNYRIYGLKTDKIELIFTKIEKNDKDKLS